MALFGFSPAHGQRHIQMARQMGGQFVNKVSPPSFFCYVIYLFSFFLCVDTSTPSVALPRDRGRRPGRAFSPSSVFIRRIQWETTSATNVIIKKRARIVVCLYTFLPSCGGGDRLPCHTGTSSRPSVALAKDFPLLDSRKSRDSVRYY